eukprot:1388338-Amorphochlora_amoeboformis.AAC.2
MANQGDEVFQTVTDGKFYVFCNGNPLLGGPRPSVDIVDPRTMTVTASIPVDNSTQWADAVYMESCDGSSKSFVLANDRSGHNVLVFDPQTAVQTDTVPMSQVPVHGYGIPQLQ